MKRGIQILFFLLLGSILFFTLPKPAASIPPPDIVMNIVQSTMGIIGASIAFVAAGLYMAKDMLMSLFRRKTTKK